MDSTTPGADPMDLREHLDAVIDELKAIRARRWLDQYPPGHPERPADPPDYVREYERRQETR